MQKILLSDLAPGQAYAIQFRSNDGRGNTSEWSQIQRFVTTNDTMPPANVSGLSFYDAGSSFVATWDRTVTNANGTALKDFKDYHVSVTNGLISVDYYVTTNRFVFSDAEAISVFGSLQSSLTISVTCRDLTYNESVFPAIATADPAAPPTPSTPGVSAYLGLIQVDWNVLDNNGDVMPANLSYCEVHASPLVNYTPDASTLVGKLIPSGTSAKYIISGLSYDTIYYIRLIAVNVLGIKSAASAAASATPKRISGLDIQNGQIGTNQINFTALDIGGANAYYSAGPPTTPATAGFKNGDLWYDTTPGNHYATYRYSSTATPSPWVAAPEVGVVAGTKILAGTITANAIGTNQIITAAANIGTAVIDSASISYVDAGKITTGILQSNATGTYAGTVQPTWSLDVNGNAIFNNATVYGTLTLGKSTATSTQNAAALVKSYNYAAGSAGWAIKGDGSVEFASGTFRGTVSGGTISGGTISGTTVSASTISGNTITGGTISGTTISGSSITGSTSRLIGTGDASLSSTGHALQTGPTNGLNLAIDVNEIQARNNGNRDTLNLNIAGGNVNVGLEGTTHTIDLFQRTTVNDSLDRDTLSVYADYDANFTNSAIHTVANEESGLENWTHFAATSANNNTPNRVFTMTGGGNGHCDGAWSGGGADFAEYFESTDGTSLPYGRAVTLENGKVRLAKAGEFIVGVTSAAPTVVGNNPLNWHDKYQRDVYGVYLLDDKDARILNPDYDINQEYALRGTRPEWNSVGLLGQIVADDDGTCTAGGFAAVANDEGQFTNSASGYLVIQRVDATHVLLLVRP